MNREFQEKLNRIADERKAKKRWLKVIASLCAVVAVGTACMLINPADTSQQETFCGCEEHKEHTVACYERTLVCQLSEEGHVHSEDCCEESRVLTCLLSETDGHTHSDACYASEEYLSCEMEETDGHQHGEDCYETEEYLSCETEETDGHRHGADCYETEHVLICSDTDEEHVHTDECYEDKDILTCQLEEHEEHHHDETCRSERQALVCGEEETAPHHHDETCYSERQVLICAEEETEPHHHDDNCYETQTLCVCGMEECEPHIHSEECYGIDYEHLLCELPIHEHTLQCFSDPEADIETASVWENTISNAKLTGKWNKDVLAIAQTQLGYTESAANYEVQEDGTTMQGYTRYGDWYGDPYGDWNAMFCSFCLNYAGVDSELMPVEASCRSWAEKLSDAEYDLYRAAGAYIPAPGDLVFFDCEEFDADHPENRDADNIGIVLELVYDSTTGELAGIKTIEGDSGNQVRENSYEIDCENIIGYGAMPVNPEWFTLEAVTDTGILVTVEGLDSALPCPLDEIALSAAEIVSEESAALLASQMEADGAEDMDSILMDISLLRADEIVEPVGPVYLSFAAKDVDIDSTVYHIDEENETVTEMPSEVNEFESTVSLETEHFSIFALTLRLNADSGKNVTATVEAFWDDDADVLSSVLFKTTSTAQICHNYDVYNGSSWTIGAGTWTAKANANTEQVFDITELVNSSTLSTKYRARVAEQTGNPQNDKSGYSEEFSLYDILDSAKAGFTDWVSGDYIEFFDGVRPTNAAQLFAAFDVYHDLPSLTLEKNFDEGVLTVTAATDAAFKVTYVWQYYDDATGSWVTLDGENSPTLNAADYSRLTPGAEPLLDGGKTVRCQLLDGDTVKAVAKVDNVNPLKEVYDAAIVDINTGLGLNAYTWYLDGAVKTANVEIGGAAFMDYFYYDNVARDPDVPFSDGESYANYLASEYVSVSESDGEDAALSHVAELWDKYIFDIFNPNPGAGVVGNYKYYPGAYTGVEPDRISTYGDKLIEWPKDNASSFHTSITDAARNGEDGLIKGLTYNFLEDGVDYSNFIQSLDKTATADAAGDFNEDRTYDIDITARTQATSVSPLAMLITVQTSWQMFDYAHANCVPDDGTYISLEVGAAQHNTEMANLYDIKKAIIRFVDWMDENFPGNNLVLGVNEIQHGGSYNMIDYYISGIGDVYVSNNSDLLHQALYDWDTFGNCEHVHYENNTDAMEDAAAALRPDLSGWVDKDNKPIRFEDINKVAVIIGGGTENRNSTNGYACVVPWDTFYKSEIDAVYGIRTNIGTPLNAHGVLSWLDHPDNNTGAPYSRDPAAGYSSSSSKGNFTELYVAPTEDAVFNYLVKIAQQELKSKGIKVMDESKNIENVTISDTVNDEFRIEEDKPFVATVLEKDESKVYETVITPADYNDAGEITAAEATFTVFNRDGTEKSVTTPAASVAADSSGITISVPVRIPYDYVLEGGEALPQVGEIEYTQTLKIKQKSDNTTDVVYDFGTVYNNDDAKLHFEIIAREDYIGSNNVFTNLGTPKINYTHVKLDSEGHRVDENGKILTDFEPSYIVPSTYSSYDTPEVNVPIRFTADNGGSVTVEVKTPVNLEDLSTTPGGTTEEQTDVVDSEYITATVHDLIDNYDQINGTVSYTWVIPGGKEYPVPVTLHVTNGDPDGDITAASEMAQKWTPKTAGIYDVVLKVTFTPDPVTDKGNFAKDGGVTATRVSKLEREGHETIIVNSASGGTGPLTELSVTKVWSGEKGNTDARPDSITFNLFQDDEFYDQKAVTSAENWSWTFTDVPYSDPDDSGHIYNYTVTEDNVPNYMTSYGDLQTVLPVPCYWEEVPMEDVDLTGETEYMIVDKSTGVAINADSDNKTPEVDLHTHEDGEYPAVLDDDAPSYFPDEDYLGWHIKYTDGSDKASNYIESASDDTLLYLKKDGSYANELNNDTRLGHSPAVDGKIELNEKKLRIKVDNNGNISITNDGTAASFTFYEKVANTALPAYRTSVTNTYIPGGERPNETSVTVNKEWLNTDTTAEIVINLLRNGKVLDTCTLNSSTGWTHTFSTLPGTDAKLPYFDPLTGETYEYTVEEEAVSGYETGYKKTMVQDPSGGAHWILFNESSVPGSSQLWSSTAYALVTPLTSGKGDKAVTADYLIGSSGSGFTNSSASVRTADDPATTETETFTFGSLSCSKELTGTVPAGAVWTVEQHTDPKGHETFLLKVNGMYLGLKKDNKNFEFVSSPKDKEPNCNWQFACDSSTGTGKLYVLTGNDYNQNKYLTLKINDKGNLEAGVDGDASKASKFTVFEQVSLQSKYDTYSYEVQNIATGVASTDGKVVYAKYIDYLADNIEDSETENPDTGLAGDYYRLYLDAVGVRDEGSAGYPEFRGVYITDHLSKYVTIADNGSNLALTINKVNVSDPDDIIYLWYGNLNPATGSIGAALADGTSVIKSVVYTEAEEDVDSSGIIRVDFEPEYCLEEGYKYIVSYNVEATDLAKSSDDYQSEGDPGTDYPGNDTSSGKQGHRSNSFADIVYTQDGDIKIGIYDHPVIQVECVYELPETGGIGTPIYALGGLAMMVSTLMYGYMLRRKRGRRARQNSS